MFFRERKLHAPRGRRKARLARGGLVGRRARPCVQADVFLVTERTAAPVTEASAPRQDLRSGIEAARWPGPGTFDVRRGGLDLTGQGRA